MHTEISVFLIPLRPRKTMEFWWTAGSWAKNSRRRMRLAQIHDAGFILGMSLFMYLCNQHSRTLEINQGQEGNLCQCWECVMPKAKREGV